jgi:hypothetical protein
MRYFWLKFSIRGKIQKKSNQTLLVVKAAVSRKYAGRVE